MTSRTKIVKYATINALSIALYVTILVLSVFYLGKPLQNHPDTILIPIGMLTLLVFSAALTGTLMLGRPIIWYLEGKKKEALQLLMCTMLILLIITIIVFITIAMVALY